ncbi:MAG: glycosyltransferase family 2 protein [Vicinamibacterales bacterium]
MTVEIVVPVFNEQDNVEKLYHEVVRALAPLSLPFVFLFVDDGSSDNTVGVLERLQATDPRVRVISFTRNFGHQAALLAGLEHATGDCVITMDGDLQHPPDVLPQLIERWQAGCDVVITTRQFGQSIGLFKRIATRAFYRIINTLSGLQMPPGAADFRLLDRHVVETITSLPERQKFLRGLISWTGFRTGVVEYQAANRHAGEVRYLLARRIQLAWDGVTAFSAAPLRVAFYLGLATFGFSVLYGAVAIAARFTGHTTEGWTSVLVSVLALGGLQMIFIGLIGEYLARVYDEVKGRPIYVIKKDRKTREPESGVAVTATGDDTAARPPQP